MARYLVTGGAGFIGSNIVEALCARGESVRVLDNFSTGKRENLAKLVGNNSRPTHEKIELIEGSVANLVVCRKAAEGMDYVLHQAALPSVPKSVLDPMGTQLINADGTLNMLLAARDAGVKRVVYAASSAAYGDLPGLPKTEGMPTNPLSPYAVQKMTGEMYCKLFFELYGLETVALRYFNVFGPRQDPASEYAAVIPKFITMMLRGEAPTIFGDGEQSRDFAYVDNVVHANLLSCQAPVEAAGQVFNIACGIQISLNMLADRIKKILKCDIPVHYAEVRAGDVKHSVADISKARRLLGYEPLFSFEEGLEKVIAWYKNTSAETG